MVIPPCLQASPNLSMNIHHSHKKKNFLCFIAFEDFNCKLPRKSYGDERKKTGCRYGLNLIMFFFHRIHIPGSSFCVYINLCLFVKKNIKKQTFYIWKIQVFTYIYHLPYKSTNSHKEKENMRYLFTLNLKGRVRFTLWSLGESMVWGSIQININHRNLNLRFHGVSRHGKS